MPAKEIAAQWQTFSTCDCHDCKLPSDIIMGDSRWGIPHFLVSLLVPWIVAQRNDGYFVQKAEAAPTYHEMLRKGQNDGPFTTWLESCTQMLTTITSILGYICETNGISSQLAGPVIQKEMGNSIYHLQKSLQWKCSFSLANRLANSCRIRLCGKQA